MQAGSLADIGDLLTLPRAELAIVPTPLEKMPNLGAVLNQANLYIKRDDYTGLGMGGNKVRQLEYYMGQALSVMADTVLITGALQSNFARLAAAAARKLGMECHIQLEERVDNKSPLYRHSGNILLDRILGATLHSFPEGENEQGADAQLEIIAKQLKAEGRRPYVIHLSAGHPPLGALGYVRAAHEILEQLNEYEMELDEIVVGSGSGATHAGLLFGLRALESSILVTGVCVRRSKEEQSQRISSHCQKIAEMLGMENPVQTHDINLTDTALAPGYGKMNAQVLDAIKQTARTEGIILDPVYTGRAMVGFLERVRGSSKTHNMLFWHTGGQSAVFGYEDDLAPILSANIASSNK